MRKRIVTAIALLALLGVLLAGRHLHKLAFIGAGYAAEQTCACLFISNRPLDSCRNDLDPLAQKMVNLKPGANEVRASSVLSSATAHFEPGFGCSLAN
jgi:hypothetical protein